MGRELGVDGVAGKSRVIARIGTVLDAMGCIGNAWFARAFAGTSEAIGRHLHPNFVGVCRMPSCQEAQVPVRRGDVARCEEEIRKKRKRKGRGKGLRNKKRNKKQGVQDATKIRQKVHNVQKASKNETKKSTKDGTWGTDVLSSPWSLLAPETPGSAIYPGSWQPGNGDNGDEGGIRE